MLALVPDFALDDRTEKYFGGRRIAQYEQEEWYGARESDLKLLAMEVSELLDAIEGGATGRGWSGGRIGRGRPRARVPRILRSPPLGEHGGGPRWIPEPLSGCGESGTGVELRKREK